jgi:hypothetical protein
MPPFQRIMLIVAALFLPLLTYCGWRVVASIVTRLRMRATIIFKHPWYIDRSDLAAALLKRPTSGDCVDGRLRVS